MPARTIFELAYRLRQSLQVKRCALTVLALAVVIVMPASAQNGVPVRMPP